MTEDLARIEKEENKATNRVEDKMVGIDNSEDESQQDMTENDLSEDSEMPIAKNELYLL